MAEMRLAALAGHRDAPHPEYGLICVIEEVGANRTLSYLPQGKVVPVVQFTADAALPASCGKVL